MATDPLGPRTRAKLGHRIVGGIYGMLGAVRIVILSQPRNRDQQRLRQDKLKGGRRGDVD